MINQHIEAARARLFQESHNFVMDLDGTCYEGITHISAAKVVRAFLASVYNNEKGLSYVTLEKLIKICEEQTNAYKE